MQMHGAGEKFHGENPNFDRNSVITAWRQSLMPWRRSWIACRSFGGNVDDMFSNIFSNDLTDEGLAFALVLNLRTKIAWASRRLSEAYAKHFQIISLER